MRVVANQASAIHIIPTIKAPVKFVVMPLIAVKLAVMGNTAPRTKLGTVLVTVDRIFVPNCSEAIVTKIAQYPEAIPNIKQRK